MAWISLTFTVGGEDASLLGEVLQAAGALSVSMENANEESTLAPGLVADFGQPLDHLWESCRVTGLFETGFDRARVDEMISLAFAGATVPAYTEQTVKEKNWVEEYHRQFTPQKISDRLWICPSWETPPDPAALNVILDPGLAFGSGTHPSTALCLQRLDVMELSGKTVIDYGCGSGILAIAAKLLGAGGVWAVDIDPQAVSATQNNMKINRTDLTVGLCDETALPVCDTMLANILANPLKELAPDLARLTRPGGTIILAGITHDQTDDVRTVYSEYFGMDGRYDSGDWVCLTGIRHDS